MFSFELNSEKYLSEYVEFCAISIALCDGKYNRGLVYFLIDKGALYLFRLGEIDNWKPHHDRLKIKADAKWIEMEAELGKR